MAVGCLPSPPVAEELIAGRYRLSNGPALGSGAWCTVHRAVDTQTGLDVAVKTYNSQALRELGDDGLSARFAREVSTFEALEIGPSGASAAGRPDPRRLRSASARLWLVNLLDYSRSASTGAPGRDADGRYYTVLELAEESLAAWLQRRAAEAKFVTAQELCEVASSVGRGLHWLHSHGFCHLDVKPENIMRFGGGGWKLIDLEGCLRLDSASQHVTASCFTPLYACPELARHALLGEACTPDQELLLPSPAMDMWALGVVLLDILVHGTAFEELKAGFAVASLFSEDAPFQQWFEWVAGDGPIVVEDFVEWPTSSARLLAESVDLQDLLRRLLHKEPEKRITASGLHKHRFLLTGMGLRREVEATFQSFEEASGRASVPTQQLSQFFSRAGLRTFEAAALLQACDPKGRGHVDLFGLLEFVYK